MSTGEPPPPPSDTPRTHKIYPELDTALGRYRLTPKQPCENDYLVEYMAHHSLTAVEGGYRWKFDPAILSHPRGHSDFWIQAPHRLARLTGRRAIIHGRKSRLFDAECVAFMRTLTDTRIPIVGVPEAYHHLMLDQPLAFTAALEAILEAWT